MFWRECSYVCINCSKENKVYVWLVSMNACVCVCCKRHKFTCVRLVTMLDVVVFLLMLGLVACRKFSLGVEKERHGWVRELCCFVTKRERIVVSAPCSCYMKDWFWLDKPETKLNVCSNQWSAHKLSRDSKYYNGGLLLPLSVAIYRPTAARVL